MKIDRRSRPAASRGIRLLLWFGIYFGAQIPLIPWTYKAWQLWPFFPMTLEWGFGGLVAWLVPRNVWDAGGDRLRDCVWWVAAALPLIYVVHLICTLCVQSRRSFLGFVWILIGILFLNIAGCAYFLHAPPQ